MPKTKRKNLRRTKIRKRKYTKKGGAPKKLNNNVNKLIRDEFAESFVVAADIGRSPTAPEEQARKTLLLRESRKQKNKVEKKSKVTGFELAKKSEGGLASAIKAGYAQGLTATSTVKSRGQSALSTLGGITGALGGPTKIPTSFSNMKQLGSQLLPQQKNTRRRGISTGTTRSRTRTNRKNSGPPGPPGEGKNDENFDDPPPPPGEISDKLQSTGDELPPPPPESKAEFCPVCFNGVDREIEIKDITKALKEMAEDKIGNMEDDESINSFVDNELSGKIKEVQKEVNKKRSEKKKKIKERREKKEKEEDNERRKKASKLKEKLEPIKKQCSVVRDIEEGDNNSNTTKKLSDLLKELESAVENN